MAGLVVKNRIFLEDLRPLDSSVLDGAEEGSSVVQEIGSNVLNKGPQGNQIGSLQGKVLTIETTVEQVAADKNKTSDLKEKILKLFKIIFIVSLVGLGIFAAATNAPAIILVAFITVLGQVANGIH